MKAPPTIPHPTWPGAGRGPCQGGMWQTFRDQRSENQDLCWQVSGSGPATGGSVVLGCLSQVLPAALQGPEWRGGARSTLQSTCWWMEND